MSQEDTYQKLLQLQQDAQARIDALQEEKVTACNHSVCFLPSLHVLTPVFPLHFQKVLKSQMEELKYSGTGALGNRRVVDDFEQYLAEAQSKCERNRVKYERLAKILVNVKVCSFCCSVLYCCVCF